MSQSDSTSSVSIFYHLVSRPLAFFSARRLLIVGLGYTGERIAHAAAAEGWKVEVTSRQATAVKVLPHFSLVPHAACAASLTAATHLLITAPPGEAGDSTYQLYAAELRNALSQKRAALRWVGYMSTTGVYGDRDGAEVDEDTEPKPGNERSKKRLQAEQEWASLKEHLSVDIFRIGGIYGPLRCALDEARAQTARCVEKPGHAFSRIHVEDITRAVMAALKQERAPGVRVLNLVDDAPSANGDVMREAAALLGLPPPPSVPFAEAVKTMTAMAKSFWAENRRVSSRKTKAALGIEWRHPSYREGLRACLKEEAESLERERRSAV